MIRQDSPIHEQLQQYALQIEENARQRERQRIARDLHDSLGHALTALNIQLQTAVKLWRLDPAKAELFLSQAQQLGSVAIQEVRQSVSSLRVTADLPLAALIESLVEDFRQGSDAVITIRVDLPEVPPEVAATLYRIVQEALTNIRKHAAATAVQVQLDTIADKVQLRIADNGVGFCLDASPEGFGLQGMAERIAALGGQFQIEADLGFGCRIRVELPLQWQASIVEEQPALVTSIISALTAAKPDLGLALSPEQISRLGTLLAEYIGAIAPTLIQQVVAQVPNCQALVERLALHIPASQRAQFERQVISLLDPSPTQAGTLAPLPDSSTQVSDERFTYQCKEALAEAIGPIAPLVIQQALQSSPQTLAELIKMLAAKIPDRQAADKFQERLRSWSQS